MPANLIDGNAIGATMRAELGGEITKLKKAGVRVIRSRVGMPVAPTALCEF